MNNKGLSQIFVKANLTPAELANLIRKMQTAFERIESAGMDIGTKLDLMNDVSSVRAAACLTHKYV